MASKILHAYNIHTKCTHAHTHTHTHTHTHIHTHTHTHSYTYTIKHTNFSNMYTNKLPLSLTHTDICTHTHSVTQYHTYFELKQFFLGTQPPKIKPHQKHNSPIPHQCGCHREHTVRWRWSSLGNCMADMAWVRSGSNPWVCSSHPDTSHN